MGWFTRTAPRRLVARPSFRPQLEALEDRWVPATVGPTAGPATGGAPAPVIVTNDPTFFFNTLTPGPGTTQTTNPGFGPGAAQSVPPPATTVSAFGSTQLLTGASTLSGGPFSTLTTNPPATADPGIAAFSPATFIAVPTPNMLDFSAATSSPSVLTGRLVPAALTTIHAFAPGGGGDELPRGGAFGGPLPDDRGMPSGEREAHTWNLAWNEGPAHGWANFDTSDGVRRTAFDEAQALRERVRKTWPDDEPDAKGYSGRITVYVREQAGRPGNYRAEVRQEWTYRGKDGKEVSTTKTLTGDLEPEKGTFDASVRPGQSLVLTRDGKVWFEIEAGPPQR